MLKFFALRPLIKALTRIADSLEMLVRIQSAWADDMGYRITPLKPVHDPAKAADVSYTDEEADAMQEAREALSRLRQEETEDELGDDDAR